MKIQTRTKIHNRFDIEVRDAKSNMLKNKGQAENIILDRMYQRLVNFNNYFNNIVFGRGTGSLDPSRITLFDRIGNKNATTEEVIKEFPISSWTRKIRLEPDEFVGEVITEVGISDHSTNINTHALIRDAEGNLLNITKTDIDIIIIYATVFIELDNEHPDVKFYENAIDNRLISYLTGSSFSNPNVLTGDVGEENAAKGIGNLIYSKSINRSADVENRKVTFSTRLGTEEGNHDIYEVALSDICRANIVNSLIWNPYMLEDVDIGTGDGETTEFDLKWYDVNNVSIKINGQLTNEYTLNNIEKDLNREKFPFWKAVDLTSEIKDLNIFSGPFIGMSIYAQSMPSVITKVDPAFLVGKTLEFVLEGQYFMSPRSARVYLDVSNDGEDFTEIYTDWNSGNGAESYFYTIEEPYEYLRFRFTGYGNTTGRIHSVSILNNVNNRPTVTFDTPPEEDAIITADYSVPFIPKTEDYVLDVDFEIQFGER
ncbi:hypothetical protein SYNTR_0900 [Candidatus Syntrophocurvum alkaliphilum]|uniref:Uncharacterized protein n=1 Tax=Candidatus Syntrophocurvum alkaliphilum TaxID=2293317 RepID=A0A6I6DGN4_9FIRM|nr:hypothetical protein [Candidatus Syntrophocurvum alkaliphilum]QGT99493.1 hypothetical protein SYNTR_0900 [Candidatus Syntrophocurvum alkaliphilum]